MDHIGLALCALAAMAVTGLSYQWGGRKGWYVGWTRLLLKGGTTLIAALLALAGALRSGLGAHCLIALGIAVCALADVALEKRFVMGMAIFALGHLCYIAAFLLLAPPGPPSLAAFAALGLTIALLAPRLGRRLGQPLPPFVLYALIISAMLALALAQRPLAALGALLFFISDSLLFSRLLRPKAGPLSDDLVILSYYAAQYLLALSTLFRHP